MPCYKPLKGYRSCSPGSSGKFSIVFKQPEFSQKALAIPCGQCIGCRIDRSRMWAIRCLHEASLYEHNCFVTLTYSSEHVPAFGQLEKRALQLFLKRLRKVGGSGIRFYACGEYGEKMGRPHFHLCLFNYDFSDKAIWSVRDGVRLYTSELLARLWPYGFSTVGDVTFESAAYVARYVMKKITGDAAEAHYTHLVPETGELVCIPSEFTVMSRRPGVGKPWLDRYQSDVFPRDYVVVRGKKCKVPRYYDSIYEQSDVFKMFDMKMNRIARGKLYQEDFTPARLAVREQVHASKLHFLKRTLE